MSDCPTPAQLDAFLAAGEQDAGIRAHVARCPTCRQRLHELREENAFLRDFIRTASAGGAIGLSAGSESATDDDVVPGYRVLRVLGRGGQAVVYEAEQRSTRRRVAVKVLVVGRRRQRRLRRFEREIELVAGLRHPHIVTVYDSGLTRDGQPYFAMEYVEGVPVTRFCQRADTADARTRIRRTLALFAEICDAVRYAHQRGIIHRDIKPSNILVDADGRPRVLDFGLARVAGDHHGTSDLTATGEFLGTLIYAAPEQLGGDARGVDTRTDVYALGVVLYEMLTGMHPYPVDGSMAEIIRNIQQRPAERPSHHLPAIDDELETIVLTALAKEPDRRYESAAALRDDIRRYLAGEPIAAKRDSTWYLLRTAARRYRGVLAAGLAFVGLLAVFAVTMTVLYRGRQRAERTARANATRLAATLSLANVERGRLMNLTGNVVLAEKLLWHELRARTCPPPTRDASGIWHLPVSPAWWGLWEVYKANPCRASIRAHHASVLAVAFEPDGQHIVSVGADGAVVRWTPARSRLEPLATLPARRLLATLTPDATALLWSHDRTVELDPIRRTEAPLRLESPDGLVTRLAVARDASRFAIATDAPSLHIASVAAGRWTHTLPGGGTIQSLSFEPDGHALWLLTDGDDGPALHRIATDTGHTLATLPVRGAAGRQLRVGPAGRMLAWAAGRKVALFSLNPPRPLATLSGHLDLLGGLAFSADASMLASAGRDRTVHIWNTTRGQPAAVLYGHADAVVRVAFSPDGTRLASGDAAGMLKLWDTRDPACRQVRTGYAIHSLALSPDGRQLALCGAAGDARTGLLELRSAVDPATPGTRLAREAILPSVTFIPDTGHLATCSTAGSVRLWTSTGRQIAARTDLPPLAHIAASPDGRQLVVSANQRPGRVFVLNADTLQVQATLAAHDARTPSVAYSPDGRQFASAGMDGTVVLWDARTLKPRARLRRHDAGVRVVRYSPGGRLIATGCDDWTVRLFGTRTAMRVQTLRGHRQQVFAIAFSPDGRLIATGDRGGIVRLWDVRTGRNLLRLDEHLPGHVMDLTFDHTGTRLLAATTSGLVIWNLTGCAPHIHGNQARWSTRRDK